MSFVTKEMGYKLAAEVGALCYVETSARTQHNITNLLKISGILSVLDKSNDLIRKEFFQNKEKNCILQ